MFIKRLLCWVSALVGLKLSACGDAIEIVRNNNDEPEQIKLLNKPPRGLALLHAMVPSARAQVLSLVDIIKESRVDKPCVAILCGRGFGFDISFLVDIVIALNQDNRSCHLLLYLTNGASQRQFETTPVDGFGTRIAPKEFRRLIQSDDHFQESYQSIPIELIPVMEANHRLGGVTRVVPQLEDNQTDASFEVMGALLKPVLPTSLGVQVGRNPCPTCWPGNGADVPKGMFLEEHTHGVLSRTMDGVVSNDGMTYLFPGETSQYPRKMKLENVKPIMRKANQDNSWFVLWSAKYQGLGGGSPKDPYTRDYKKPTHAERTALVEFLQS